MFDKDLKLGKNVEREFAKVLLDMGASSITFAPEWRFKDWDILAIIDNTEKTYEVKADLASNTTWNVGFEYYFNTECSGIFASKADYIVYWIDDRFYCISRPVLLVRLEFIKKEDKIWWDSRLARMFIVPKSDFFMFVRKKWWISDLHGQLG